MLKLVPTTFAQYDSMATKRYLPDFEIIKWAELNLRYFFPFLIAVLSFGLGAQSTASPEGRWYTFDDETGERKSVVEIYRADGKFHGKVAEILTDKKDAVCSKCDGERKNQPVLGMVIIEDLEPEDDYWSGGSILDPNKGSTYKLSAWYEGDADVLYIRGKHWTGLYRTQTWKRAE